MGGDVSPPLKFAGCVGKTRSPTLDLRVCGVLVVECIGGGKVVVDEMVATEGPPGNS